MAYGVLYDFLMGQSIDAYKYFGAHFEEWDGRKGCVFRVYAPSAKSVNLIGEFNNWDLFANPMIKVDESGVWETFVEGVQNYQAYKFHICNCNGEFVDKADPFGFFGQYRPGSCSKVFDYTNFAWHDQIHMQNRNRNFDRPMSIYEIHAGSWLPKDEDRFYSFEELADRLIDYVLKMGYTHVELMPVTAYPFDGSWGYQSTGFYAVDARYGNPHQLMSFVDRCHVAGIGVILDFVVVHFATDKYALERFDGSCLYEYSGDHEFSQWGSKMFDLGKDPVRSFLMSSAGYFLDQFHFDGIRYDAISNIVFWDGNKQNGVNDGAVEFIKRMTGKLHIAHNDVMLIAEDSTDFQGVTKPLEYGGLGFDYKWDLGWMNDTLKFYAKDPIYRRYHQNLFNFSMAYFYSENFLLPLSHDEVVHGKGTIINKMWGDYDNKFAQIRNLYTYMWAHPGKKLNFMGNELATFDEWSESKSLAWNLQGFPKHDSIKRLVRDLNMIYKTEPAMYIEEHNPARFQWLIADNPDQCIYAFKRAVGDECLIFVFNMTPNYYEYINLGVPLEGEYVEIFNADKDVYGGWNHYNGLPLHTTDMYWNNQPYTISLKLASFGALILKRVVNKPVEVETKIDEKEEAKAPKVEAKKTTKKTAKKATTKKAAAKK